MYTESEQQIIDQAKAIVSSYFKNVSGPISSARAAKDFLQLEIANLPHEVFVVVHMDTQHRVLEVEQLFRGTIDGSAVYPMSESGRDCSITKNSVKITHYPSGRQAPGL